MVLLAGGIWAQAPHGRQRGPNPDILQRLERMSPEERRRVLDRLPPGRRARIEQRLRDYEKLSPQERRRLRRQYGRFREMRPEEQDRARKLFRMFQQLRQDRRHAVRQEYMRLSRMNDEDRLARISTPEYRAGFTDDERRMIDEMLALAPE